MARPAALILHAPGTNRDRDVALALDLAGADSAVRTVDAVVRGEVSVDDFQLLILPGGFSYGDELGAGRLWALELRHGLGHALSRFVASGKPALGICNGFQALVKAGLLPGPAPADRLADLIDGDDDVAGDDGGAGAEAVGGAFAGQRVSLARNADSLFVCRWVWLRPDVRCRSPWLDGLRAAGPGARVLCPVAHGEGRVVASDADLDQLEGAGQIALRYAADDGSLASRAPDNPNGSARAIAGMCNAAGNVLGLMPHPENHVLPWQHPRHTRGEGGSMGLSLFAAGVRFAGRC